MLIALMQVTGPSQGNGVWVEACIRQSSNITAVKVELHDVHITTAQHGCLLSNYVFD
jgi:hypothetical protein